MLLLKKSTHSKTGKETHLPNIANPPKIGSESPTQFQCRILEHVPILTGVHRRRIPGRGHQCQETRALLQGDLNVNCLCGTQALVGKTDLPIGQDPEVRAHSAGSVTVRTDGPRRESLDPYTAKVGTHAVQVKGDPLTAPEAEVGRPGCD